MTIAKLRGQVVALYVLTTTLAHIVYRHSPERLPNWIARFRDDYTLIPFRLSDDEAEGFRQMMDDILDGLQNLPSLEDSP